MTRIESRERGKMSQQQAHQEAVTKKLIELMEQGNLSWVRPSWQTTGQASMPSNGYTGHKYRGANVVTLWAQAIIKGYTSSQWATFKQIRMLGGHVLKGETSTAVFLWKPATGTSTAKDEQTGEETSTHKKRLVFKTYLVFNLDQTSVKKKAEIVKTEFEAHAEADQFIGAIPHSVSFGGDSACYAPLSDEIRMPHKETFIRSSAFYATYLHELTHWTGHKARENRPGVANLQEGKGHTKSIYAFEELVAELGSAFMCASIGINEPDVQHATYLKHWAQMLREDSTAIFRAASLAAKACDYLAKGANKKQTQAA